MMNGQLEGKPQPQISRDDTTLRNPVVVVPGLEPGTSSVSGKRSPAELHNLDAVPTGFDPATSALTGRRSPD
jgi:hypothetical protein